MNKDLKKIKRKYGEDMMKFCRSSFSTLLEHDGLLSEILLEHFPPSRVLYQDIHYNGKENEFKNYIYTLVGIKKGDEIDTDKTPTELMSEAGYDLFECNTESEVQSFRKYYARGERLCTFDGQRLDRCRVFFAVKKDVEDIKRENFYNPKREDSYGTSVISIQFTKDANNTLSIKNRYNHSVENPDATFSNNLENIIPGLTKSFEKEYGLVQKFSSYGLYIPQYIFANDGKYYKYSYEYWFDDYVYYCPTDNVIIDHGEVKTYAKEKYIFFDYFILDLPNKKIYSYDEKIKDSFVDTIGEIEKIVIEPNGENKEIKITPKNGYEIKIVVDKSANMIEYVNNNIEKIDDKFLYYSTGLKRLELQNVKKIGNEFLNNSEKIDDLIMPSVEEVGNYFLYNVEFISDVNLPNLKKTGSHFLSNLELSKIDFPNLEEIGDWFLSSNRFVNEMNLPNLKKIGNFFLINCFINKLDLPNLEEVGNDFLYENNSLKSIHLPKLKKVGDYFFEENNTITDIKLPLLREVGNGFFLYNNSVTDLYLPSLQKIGKSFFSKSNSLKNVILPQVKEVGDYFIKNDNNLENLYAPKLQINTGKLLNNHLEIKKQINKHKIFSKKI